MKVVKYEVLGLMRQGNENWWQDHRPEARNEALFFQKKKEKKKAQSEASTAQESYKSRRVVWKGVERSGKAWKAIMRSHALRTPSLRLFFSFFEKSCGLALMLHALPF